MLGTIYLLKAPLYFHQQGGLKARVPRADRLSLRGAPCQCNYPRERMNRARQAVCSDPTNVKHRRLEEAADSDHWPGCPKRRPARAGASRQWRRMIKARHDVFWRGAAKSAKGSLNTLPSNPGHPCDVSVYECIAVEENCTPDAADTCRAICATITMPTFPVVGSTSESLWRGCRHEARLG